ncbi:MAG: hypothetical protein HY743_09465 [Deltaproteobacteria bacterium]|nr:hypothetical protein [Deltaproteobacteria bacterium]
MARLMVAIDVPELTYEEMRQAMLRKEECRMVDFDLGKSANNLATVAVDAACIRRCKYGLTPARYLFELIGVMP